MRPSRALASRLSGIDPVSALVCPGTARADMDSRSGRSQELDTTLCLSAIPDSGFRFSNSVARLGHCSTRLNDCSTQLDSTPLKLNGLDASTLRRSASATTLLDARNARRCVSCLPFRLARCVSVAAADSQSLALALAFLQPATDSVTTYRYRRARGHASTHATRPGTCTRRITLVLPRLASPRRPLP